MKNVIIKEQHKNDCAALNAVDRGDWGSPWFLKGDRVYLDKRGQSRGNTTCWLVAVCNDPNCPAKALARESWLEDAIYTEQE